jgi:hypothetical protein
VLALLGMAAAASIARAHIVSDRDVRVLAQLPPGFAGRALAAFAPDSLGYVRPNAPGAWRSISHQRAAMLLLLDALAHSDSIAAERAWRAIDVTWYAQRGDGGFENAEVPGADSSAGAKALGAEAAWMAALTRAQVAATNSGLAPRFRWRHALLLPKLKHAMDHLEAHQSELLSSDSTNAGALFVTAAAFLIAQGMFHDARFGHVGQQALSRALLLERPDGALPVNGREDLALQTIGLEALQSINIYFPSPTLEQASVRAAEWLKKPAHGSALDQLNRGAPGESPYDVGAGEVEFVLRYAAIKPPPPGPKTVEAEH